VTWDNSNVEPSLKEMRTYAESETQDEQLLLLKAQVERIAKARRREVPLVNAETSDNFRFDARVEEVGAR
jgi:hypothetical protein